MDNSLPLYFDITIKKEDTVGTNFLNNIDCPLARAFKKVLESKITRVFVGEDKVNVVDNEGSMFVYKLSEPFSYTDFWNAQQGKEFTTTAYKL